MSNIPNNRIYYAQNREDLILESFFNDTKKGFYVDVGACHPDVASVTKRFYLKGWRGINIEPQTNLYNLFEKDRKRDINLNIGISDKDTTLVLRNYINSQGLSTFTPELQSSYEAKWKSITKDYEDIEVRVSTLKAVLLQHKVRSIQFMKIDVEGHEYEVLSGNDWSRFRPEVICIEQTPFKDWRSLLKKNGYKLVFSDGLNEYYTDSNTDRAKKFNYVDHVVLDLKGGIAAEDYAKITQLEEINAQQARELNSVKHMLNRVARLSPSRVRNKLNKRHDSNTQSS